jgi:hypothetical protein
LQVLFRARSQELLSLSLAPLRAISSGAIASYEDVDVGVWDLMNIWVFECVYTFKKMLDFATLDYCTIKFKFRRFFFET